MLFKSNGFKLLRTFVCLVLVVMVLPLSTFASNGSGFVYEGAYTEGTKGVVEQQPNMFQVPAIFEIKSQLTDKQFYAFCAAWGIEIQSGAVYDLVHLSQITPQVDKVRGIIQKGYPHTSLSDFRTFIGNQSLSEADAISITQFALWNAIDGVNLISSSGRTPERIISGYQKLLQVAPAPREALANLVMTKPEFTQDGNTIRIKFRYGPQSPTVAELNLGYWTNLQGFRQESKVTEANWTEVVLAKTYSNLNRVEDFSCYVIKIYGTQAYLDVYGLTSASGSQSLVTYESFCQSRLTTVCYYVPRFAPITPWSQYDGRFYNFYRRGTLVTYEGKTYQALLSHIVYSPSWTPSRAPSLWRIVR